MARNYRTWETCSLPFQHVLFVEDDPRVPSYWTPTLSAADIDAIRRATGIQRFITAVTLYRRVRAAQKTARRLAAERRRLLEKELRVLAKRGRPKATTPKVVKPKVTTPKAPKAPKVVPPKVTTPKAPKAPKVVKQKVVKEPLTELDLSYDLLRAAAFDYGLAECDLKALILTEPRLASFRHVVDD